MPTLLTRVPTANPASAGLAPISISNEEIAMYSDARLVEMWRADVGFSGGGWKGRKAEFVLLPRYTVIVPTVQTITAYGNQASLLWGSGASNGQLYKNGILPIGADYSVIFFGRAGPSDNVFFWGNDTGGTKLNENSSGTVSQYQGGGSNSYIGSATGAAPLYAAGPALFIACYNYTTKKMNGRINRGAITYTGPASTSNLTENDNTNFNLGAGNSTNSGSWDGGDISDLIILNVDVTAAAHSDLLANVENYFHNRYGI